MSPTPPTNPRNYKPNGPPAPKSTPKRARYRFPLHIAPQGGARNLFPNHVKLDDQAIWHKLEGGPGWIFGQDDVEDVASKLYTTELAMVGELLARGGADYRSHWAFGTPPRVQYARLPIMVKEFFNPKHKKNKGVMLFSAPYDNPLVDTLLAAKPQCACIVGFDNLPFAKAVYKRAIELHLDQIERAADNPYALSPRHTGKP
jgi:hypothetical protein